ncbi:hypothetical protein DDD_0185 [Nonlabens dokdonensis DSW-6]|uniref:Uncharacterized protein n=1 Tax=Nonlabens dokdonensis (strain DSM 17205 / KCTC 12402 / DSW-6) TaxID=592029 RepID=L7W910_NONDD|nr:hypothetical protein DDD_0185 [Nonlabens dokdonensis DSW-6]
MKIRVSESVIRLLISCIDINYSKAIIGFERLVTFVLMVMISLSRKRK